MRQAPAAVSDPAAAWSQPFPASVAASAAEALGFIFGHTTATMRTDLCIKMVGEVMPVALICCRLTVAYKRVHTANSTFTTGVMT